MKSYTTLRNLFGSLANNTATATLTLADQLINDKIRAVCSERNWPFLHTSKTDTTVASQQAYNLPANCDKVLTVTVTQGSTIYVPTECSSQAMWNRLNRSSQSSTSPTYWFVDAGQLKFYPTPSTSSLTITYVYRKRFSDLSMADYTTGNVSALTSGTTTVTGASTSWTVPMAGRWIKITPTSTAGQTGDGMWYEIASVASATSLTLSRPYLGTTITGNTAYTIGEMPVLPEAYHDLPVHGALEVFYTSVQPDSNRAQLFKRLWDEGRTRLTSDHGNQSLGVVLDDGADRRFINPNLTITA